MRMCWACRSRWSVYTRMQGSMGCHNSSCTASSASGSPCPLPSSCDSRGCRSLSRSTQLYYICSHHHYNPNRGRCCRNACSIQHRLRARVCLSWHCRWGCRLSCAYPHWDTVHGWRRGWATCAHHRSCHANPNWCCCWWQIPAEGSCGSCSYPLIRVRSLPTDKS